MMEKESCREANGVLPDDKPARTPEPAALLKM
jgi:hypothetical protein